MSLVQRRTAFFFVSNASSQGFLCYVTVNVCNFCVLILELHKLIESRRLGYDYMDHLGLGYMNQPNKRKPPNVVHLHYIHYFPHHKARSASSIDE